MKKAGGSVKKAAQKATRGVRKAASNPRRTVAAAADNVHQTATRARGMGESVVTAGEIIVQTADMVDAMAARAKSRTRRRRTPTSKQDK
ncbi:MAG: hypothetical protein JO078_01315 [Candidatus Eremiobacteraeota bacterium]|nr:hypothetical protein [Candidatus Eremiobacteraeota bacterium]MBV9057218.1 hypothetical protein [Candidatus Eremiobacteraeota bacterium]MBV9698740.1 hypothetical protein [Candidatus Eremiobacteraeota bacterium]